MENKREITIEEVQALKKGEILEVDKFHIELIPNQRKGDMVSVMGQKAMIGDEPMYQVVDFLDMTLTHGDAQTVTEFFNGLNGFGDFYEEDDDFEEIPETPEYKLVSYGFRDDALECSSHNKQEVIDKAIELSASNLDVMYRLETWEKSRGTLLFSKGKDITEEALERMGFKN